MKYQRGAILVFISLAILVSIIWLVVGLFRNDVLIIFNSTDGPIHILDIQVNGDPVGDVKQPYPLAVPVRDMKNLFGSARWIDHSPRKNDVTLQIAVMSDKSGEKQTLQCKYQRLARTCTAEIWILNDGMSCKFCEEAF